MPSATNRHSSRYINANIQLADTGVISHLWQPALRKSNIPQHWHNKNPLNARLIRRLHTAKSNKLECAFFVECRSIVRITNSGELKSYIKTYKSLRKSPRGGAKKWFNCLLCMNLISGNKVEIHLIKPSDQELSSQLWS